MPHPAKQDDEITAKVVHEAMRAYAAALGEAEMPPWDAAPDWMHAATREGVLFRQQNPDATGADQHAQWVEEKAAAGWRHGPVKDADAKTHPMMVPFADLPATEKRKDALFAAVVRALSGPV